MSEYNRIWREVQRNLPSGYKSGGAYTGWRPRPSLPGWLADFILVAAATLLVVIAIEVFHL